MTASDIMRLTTIAQDTASIVASFVPGAGTAVSAGLGVTSTATDLVADIMDPAVSGGEVAKNLAVNAGFAVIGMIPGAKMGKTARTVVKTVAKWGPRLLTLAAGAGLVMDKSVQDTFKKIGDGSINFTRQDWKNIARVFQLAAGATRTGRAEYDNYKVNKASAISKDNVTLKGVKSTTSGEDMQLPKKTVDDINAKLQSAEIKTEDDAINALLAFKNESGTPIFANKEQAKSALATSLFDKVKIGKKDAKPNFKLVGTKEAIDTNKTYDNLREIWNKDAEALKRQSEWKIGDVEVGKGLIWFGNRFGGGAYTGRQRAIMQNALDPKSDIAKTLAGQMEYDSWYNPAIDWRVQRTEGGMRMMPQRASSTTNSNSTTNTSNQNSNSYVNLGRTPESDEMNNAGFSQNWGTISKTAADEARALAQNKAGITISNNDRFLKFVQHLRKNDPDHYKARLGNKRFMQAAKEEYQFR
jgi:hypothetical protein